jgi:hypothetical protein
MSKIEYSVEGSGFQVQKRFLVEDDIQQSEKVFSSRFVYSGAIRPVRKASSPRSVQCPAEEISLASKIVSQDCQIL